MPTRHANHRYVAVCSVISVTIVFSGCTATAPKTAAPAPKPPAAYATPARWEPADDLVPVMRQGRYTLVELAPASEQRDLLRQLVEINLPASRKATVGDALRRALSPSGYRICANSEVAALNALPLPAPHHRLGPIMLRDALVTLAGPGWDLVVNDAERRVCFIRAPQLVTEPINLTQAVEAGAVRPAPAIARKSLP